MDLGVGEGGVFIVTCSLWLNYEGRVDQRGQVEHRKKISMYIEKLLKLIHGTQCVLLYII